MTNQAELEHVGVQDNGRIVLADQDDQTVSVAEAPELLGRDRTRVYALLRSGDLVAASDDEDGAGPVRILRASLDRWVVAGGAAGAPLSPRNAWALIGLASGDQAFSERCLGVCSSARKSFPARERGWPDEKA